MLRFAFGDNAIPVILLSGKIPRGLPPRSEIRENSVIVRLDRKWQKETSDGDVEWWRVGRQVSSCRTEQTRSKKTNRNRSVIELPDIPLR